MFITASDKFNSEFANCQIRIRNDIPSTSEVPGDLRRIYMIFHFHERC